MESFTNTGGIFKAQNIKKYWKNQQHSKNNTQKYCDPYFPANDSSIYGLNSKGEYIDKVDGLINAKDPSLSNIEWKRAADIFSNFLIFKDKIEVDDIKQGALGNCYFLSALAALCEFPELIYQIFVTKEVSPYGYYEVVLFIDGEWQVVIVDDFFPVIKGTKEFKFSKPNGNELWVVLLEKAWAKINSGYSNIIAGWPKDPFIALTGFASKMVLHSLYIDNKTDELWKLLQQADKNDNIMCVSTNDDINIDSMGLVRNHAYTLIAAKEFKNLKLVQIRNPWGFKEWNGRFSDTSKDWTDEIKKHFNYTNADDGTFYMSFEDFIKYFRRTDICYIAYKSFVKTFKMDLTKNLPYIYNFYINSNSQISVSAIKKFWRYNREIKGQEYPVSVVLFKLNDNSIDFIDGEHSTLANAELVDYLEKGYYGVWVYCPRDCSGEPKLSDLTVRITSDKKFQAKLVTYDHNFDYIREVMKLAVRNRNIDRFNKKESFCIAQNEFLKTGIGFRYDNNQTSNLKNLKVETSGNLCIFMLPPYSNKSQFEYGIPANSDIILLGLKTSETKTYWFNLKTTTINSSMINVNNITNFSHNNFINKEVSLLECGTSFYDYITLSTEECKLEHNFDFLEIKIEDVPKKYPKEYEILSKNIDEIKDNQIRKWATNIYDNGIYVGQFSNKNLKDGRGIYIWNSGQKYIGQWKEDKKHGKTIEYDNEKVSFKGTYLDGKRQGFGECWLNSGDYISGDYKDGLKQGKGIYIWANGGKWEGPFENDCMHGEGLYTPAGKTAFKATYNNHQYIR